MLLRPLSTHGLPHNEADQTVLRDRIGAPVLHKEAVLPHWRLDIPGAALMLW